MMSTILALKIDRNKRVRRGSDYIWQVIRDLTAEDKTRPVYLSEIMAKVEDASPSSVKLDIKRMALAGLVSPQASIAGPCWTVLKRPTRLPPIGRNGVVARSGQASMWTAMRALKVFDARELSIAASTEERPVSLVTAKSYLQRLNAAGYLQVTRPATPKRIAAYRLKPSMDIGPDAPRILRSKLVYDPNLHEVMGLADAEDDL